MTFIKNIIALIIMVFSFGFCASVPETYADIHRAASVSYADVSAAVASASPGDIVEVPAGSTTWGNTLTLSRGITLQGAGIDLSIITGKRILISWSPNTTAIANHETLVVKGFTLDGNNATSADLGYTGLIFGENGTTYVTLVILSNKFENTTGTGIWFRGSIYGVAALNQFDRIADPIRIMGNDEGSWATHSQEYGSANNFYFEDNTIGYSSAFAGDAGWLETGQGGRIAVRYNTWENSNASPGEFWDVHGLQNPAGPGASNCEGYSTMIAEYYGNQLINLTSSYRWMYHRGGWLMMFNNALSSTTNPGNSVTQYFCDTCQKTGSYVQKVDNTYFWANLVNGSNKIATIGDPGAGFGCASDPLVENNNFFNYNSACTATSCSSGIGVGSATPTGTCKTGVAYWKTVQSFSNLTGMVGANPTTPISGTLYKCTTTNTWTPYFTPYTYPHPLRAESGAMVPPTGVRITN